MMLKRPICMRASSFGSALEAEQDGVIDYISEKEIVLKADGKRPVYALTEGRALVSRKIMVQPGDEVRKGQVLAEELVRTTVGRVILSEILPEGVDFSAVNRVMNKKALAQLIDTCYRSAGVKATVILADRAQGYRLPLCDPLGNLHFDQRHDHSGAQVGDPANCL